MIKYNGITSKRTKFVIRNDKDLSKLVPKATFPLSSKMDSIGSSDGLLGSVSPKSLKKNPFSPVSSPTVSSPKRALTFLMKLVSRERKRDINR